MFDHTAHRHLIERRLRLALAFFRKGDVSLYGFLHEPSPRPVELAGKTVQFPGELCREMRRHDSSRHVQSLLINSITDIKT